MLGGNEKETAMSTALRLLILEDDPIDAELEVAALEEAGYACQWERVDTRPKFLASLDTPEYDAILADYTLPSFDGLTALQLFLARDLDIPFIFVSGAMGEEAAIESLKAGATDYVLKERLSRLAPIMKRALQEREKHQQQKKLEKALREREERFRSLIQHSSDIIIILEADGTVRYVSPAAERIVGYSVDPLVTSDPFEYIHPDDVPMVQEKLAQAIQDPGIPINAEFRLRHQNGSWIPIESIANNLLDQPEVHGIVINARDITERKRAEEELLREKTFSDSLLNSLPTTFFMFDTKGELIRCNDKFLEQAGLSAEQAKDKQIADFVSEQDLEFVLNAVQKVFTEGQVEIEAHAITKDGEITPYHFTASRIIFDDQAYLLGTGIDITQRKQAEAKIERALRETFVRLEVSQALSAAQTEEQVLDVLAEQSGLYPQVGTEILTFEPDKEDNPTLVSRRSSSFDSGFPETPAGTRFPASEFPIVNLITPNTLFASADVLHDERVDENTRAIAIQEGWGSIAIVPVTAGDNWLGIVFAASRQKEYFDPSKLALYQTLAEQGATALQIARLNDSIQRNLKETQVRLEVSQALAGTETEDEVLDVLIQHAALYPQAHTTILTFDRTGDKLAIIPRRVDPSKSRIAPLTHIGMRIPVSRYPGLDFFSVDQPFVSNDISTDERAGLAGREITRQSGATSLAGFPLAAGNERMG
jgi:PAS domain S-box-containing protein